MSDTGLLSSRTYAGKPTRAHFVTRYAEASRHFTRDSVLRNTPGICGAPLSVSRNFWLRAYPGYIRRSASIQKCGYSQETIASALALYGFIACFARQMSEHVALQESESGMRSKVLCAKIDRGIRDVQHEHEKKANLRQ